MWNGTVQSTLVGTENIQWRREIQTYGIYNWAKVIQHQHQHQHLHKSFTSTRPRAVDYSRHIKPTPIKSPPPVQIPPPWPPASESLQPKRSLQPRRRAKGQCGPKSQGNSTKTRTSQPETGEDEVCTRVTALGMTMPRSRLPNGRWDATFELSSNSEVYCVQVRYISRAAIQVA
jgi:hypothetical protein